MTIETNIDKDGQKPPCMILDQSFDRMLFVQVALMKI